MPSLQATPNLSYINGDTAFRSSKSLYVSFLCGTWEQFSASGYKYLQEFWSGPFWSKTQDYGIVYLSAFWFLCKSNANISKGNCCMLQQLRLGLQRTRAQQCTSSPPTSWLRSISRIRGKWLLNISKRTSYFAL